MSNLTSKFDASRQLPEDDQWHLMRAEYFIQMHGGDGVEFYPSSVRSAYSDNVEKLVEQKKRDKQNLDHAMMALSDRLKDIENRLIDKYGEYFAENLAAEHLDEDTYKELMTIQDQDERRKAIAIEINKGIGDGSINSKEVYSNPDLEEWLKLHEEMKNERSVKQSVHITNEDSAKHIENQNKELESGLDSFLP